MDSDVGTGFSQRDGDTRAQSTRRPGDERYLALQTEFLEDQGIFLSGWSRYIAAKAPLAMIKGRVSVLHALSSSASDGAGSGGFR
jgi:hypothetical protein